MKYGRIVGVIGALIVLTVARSTADDPISLDVLVSDVKSRPITNLSLADFELIDAGEPRAVEAVQLKSGAGRVLGLLLDDFHVSAGEATDRVKAALSGFVDNELHDDDLVAVVRPLDPLHAIVFTQDRDVLRQAVAAFQGRRGDYTPRTEFERNFMSRDPKTADATRAQVVSAALQALARRLGDDRAGRKALIVVTEGFMPMQPRAIIHAANRAGVALHVIDPLPDPDDTDPILRTFAEQTAGHASLNERDLVPAFSQTLRELDTHYVVTFRLSGPGDGQFHPVQVRVKRAGARVRARAGYWAPSPVKPAPADATASATRLPFRPSRSSPYIRPWVGMSRGPDGLTRVTVTWEPGTAPPRNQQLASVTVKALAGDGRVLFENRVGPGQASRATFDAQPGLVALELAIQSSTGAPLDTDYRGISVPNLKVTKPTVATLEVLRTRTARSFAEVSVDPDAIPVASRVFSLYRAIAGQGSSLRTRRDGARRHGSAAESAWPSDAGPSAGARAAPSWLRTVRSPTRCACPRRVSGRGDRCQSDRQPGRSERDRALPRHQLSRVILVRRIA